MAKMATLKDSFVSSALDTTKWTPFTGGSATLSYGNGVTCNYPASSTSSTDGDISSNTTYDLTSSYAFVQVTGTPSASTLADATFQVRINSSNMCNWTFEGGTLYAQKLVSNSRTTLNSFAYNASTHAWWQIRESGGVTYWETSSDGLNWVVRASQSNPIAVTALTVVLAGTCFQNETNPGTFTWANFNNLNSDGPYNHLRVQNGMSRSEVAN